jgi:D-proline reductase (dithiol) PrdB
VTTAGISMKSDSPFDMQREKTEPAWGDPSYRAIPRTATEKEIEVSHLHIKTDYIKQDINVMLPLTRFQEFEKEGLIGKLAPTCYSYYGFQLDPTVLLNETMPEVAGRMREENVEAVLITPA